MEFTLSALSPEQRAYLAGLPLVVNRTVDDTEFVLCHAAPSDPLYQYGASQIRRLQWEREMEGIDADQAAGWSVLWRHRICRPNRRSILGRKSRQPWPAPRRDRLMRLTPFGIGWSRTCGASITRWTARFGRST